MGSESIKKKPFKMVLVRGGVKMKELFVLGLFVVVLVAGCTSEQPAEVETLAETPISQAVPAPEQVVVETQPSIAVDEQEVENEQVIITRLFLDNPGYIVIHKVADGAPGPVIGNSELLNGENSDVSVEISDYENENELIAMLHYDDGDEGYEFPGDDAPAQLDGSVVLTKFLVLNSQPSEEPVATAEVEPVATAEAESSSEEVTVEITSSGFVPRTVSINTGDTVTFVNNNGPARWPASNRHPIHTNYPADYSGGSFSGSRACAGLGNTKPGAFDACQRLNTGEQYSIMFNEVGSWFYHDHLNPSRGGTIVVE